jgi:4-hydroxybenzoate polyprenyltransferase
MGRPFSLFELVSYVLMFASVPMLAYGIHKYDSSIITIICLTVLALYSGFFATLIWNDINDKKIDAVVHPRRLLPSEKITVKTFFSIALIFSGLTFIFSYLVNLWCFIFVGCAALFVTFHNKYLKKKVKIPAYSEIFTPVQWIIVPIFGYLAINNSNIQDMILLVIFTYFTDNAHDLPEGIHDIDGDKKFGIRTYATSFGGKNAAKIAFFMFILSGLLGILLFIRTILTMFFLIFFLLAWLYILYHSYQLIKVENRRMKELGRLIGKKGFNYFLIVYDLIFLDLLIQIIFNCCNCFIG